MNRLRALAPTWPEVRAVGRWLWVPAHAPRIERPDAPDSGLVDLLAPEFTTVHDVLERLHEAEMRLRAVDDRRAVFLTVYTRMTEQVQVALDAGEFNDPEWVADYLVDFANAYREAFVAYERESYDEVPPPWRVAFDAALAGDTLVLQDALLGVNAHINYDLTYTLASVGIDPERTLKHADHDHVDVILGRLVDAVQDTLVDVYDALGVSNADVLLGDVDEQVMLIGLTTGRDFAWANAVMLADLPVAPARRLVEWRLRAVALGAAHLIRRSTPSPSTSARIRQLERDANTAASFAAQLDRHAPRRRPGAIDAEPTESDT
jgi:hypothetical protein